MLLAGRRSLWDWLAGGDFSDTILGLDTIPGLGVEGSLLSDIIRLFLGANAATAGFVCEVAEASRGLDKSVLEMKALRLRLPEQVAWHPRRLN
jgi:hypothetical protein